MYYNIRCNFFYNHFTGLNTAKVGPFARGLRLTSTARTGAAFTSTALCFPGERRLGSSEPTVRLLSPRRERKKPTTKLSTRIPACERKNERKTSRGLRCFPPFSARTRRAGLLDHAHKTRSPPATKSSSAELV